MGKDSANIAVIGAGVVGMTTAKLIQDELRHANITIFADKFHRDTVSTVAAGIFRPGTSFKGSSKEITKKWIDDAWYYWQEILASPDAPEAGLMRLSTYIFSKENYHVTRNHLIEDLVPEYRPVTDNELKLCGDGWKYGSYFSTLKIECQKHLPWVERIFTSRGGKIVTRKIDSFASLKGDYDLVFNCTGLGAKFLCKDDDLVPLRGQVVKVRAPWLKMAYYGDYDTYVIPGFDGIVTCGGVRQYDSYNMSVCKYDSGAIMDRCCDLVPGLRQAEVVETKVGLRPHRMPVRVERELVDGVRVVHNYGHGGYGVMSSPGTSINAVQIGIDLLKSNVRAKL